MATTIKQKPWRSFASVINKCLTRKSIGFDRLRLSQAQILWGLYHKINVDYAFLIWEDLVYQVEHKNQKKSNEMYYLRFTKVSIHYFMTKKPLIPRRNRVNWHYFRDDILFSTIKVVSRHQNTQQYGAILPIELTTEDIRNTKAYKEYYACATGEAAPKLKASARKKRGGSVSSTTPPTPIATPTPTTTVVATPRLTAAAKGKQPARATSPAVPLDIKWTKAEQIKIVLRRSRHETQISQQGGSSTDEGTGSRPGVPDVPSDDSKEELSWNSSDDEDVDDQTKGSDDNEGQVTDESDDDDDDQDEAEKVNDDNDDEEEISKIGEQEATESDEGDDEATESDKESKDEETREQEEEKEEADELYRDVDINQGRVLQVSQIIKDSHVTLTPTHSDGQQESLSTSSFMTNLLNPTMDPGMESIFTTGSSIVTPIPSPQSTMTPSIILTFTTASQLPTPPTPIPSLDLQSLSTFASVFHFKDKVKLLEVIFSNIPGIVNQYMHQQMPEAVREAVQTQTDRLQDSIQRENDEFLKTIDDNMKKIIKEHVKTQVKAQVTRIFPRIEESKILIDKMEGNKSIQRSDEQWNLYKALVEAYDTDKTILDTYGESTILKRRREEDDDQEGPFAGSNRGSKRQIEGGEHASASTLSKPATGKEPVQTTCQMEEPSHLVFETGAEDQPIVQTSQHPEWFSQPRRPPTPDCDWNKSLPATQGDAQSWISALTKQTDARSSFNKLLGTPIDFSNFIMNRLNIDTLTPKLLAGPTYGLIRGSCNSLTELEYHLEEVYKETTDHLDWVNPDGQQYPHNLLQPLPLIPNNRGRRVIPFEHFTNNDLEYLQGGASSQKYATSITKTKAADYGHIKWIKELVPRAMWILEPINYDKHALWGVSH
nr:hypothetical protein [Tanacetum cinerariifolium]